MKDNSTTNWTTVMKKIRVSEKSARECGNKWSPYETMIGCPPKVSLSKTSIPNEILQKTNTHVSFLLDQTKLPPIDIEDNVTIPIPSVDRGCGDRRKMLCIVTHFCSDTEQYLSWEFDMDYQTHHFRETNLCPPLFMVCRFTHWN